MTALEVVFFDIGGVLYRDDVYRLSLLTGLRELGADVGRRAFDREYDRIRTAQSGSFSRQLARRFLGPEVPFDEFKARASRHWAYPPEALEPDARPCLEALSKRYRLGIVANQPSAVREAMRRDGIEGFFEAWGVSDDLDVDKPDARIFAHALDEAVVEPARSAVVGDRLDYDVRPAKALGMRAVWVLRGEAPDHPSPEQLAEADGWVRTLSELPEALGRLSR